MWLDDLQDMAYDVEDIVNEFAIEALGRKMMAAEHDSTGTSKVWNLIPFCFPSLSPIAVKFNVCMRSKLKDITRRLEEISKQRIELGLEMVAGATSTATWKRLPSTCLPIEPAVCGRDEDKAKFFEMVLMDEPTGANFSLDSIAERFCNKRSIECICIKRCANLRSIPEGLHSLSGLREIYMEDCPSLVFFPEGGDRNVVTHLSNQKLTIARFPKLELPSRGFQNLSSLEFLWIREIVPCSHPSQRWACHAHFCNHLLMAVLC
ncbi:hypothetical protein Ddye_027103 [Dipteronia dyeriana]|uniref:Disease resistance N-terminal domain-containing protein n=1 Tax=Dipteronia dyeriana TaxID=168575 RepID=A0AAD9TPA0_9ROSI|nr:hypothetical protein Ddye_027103 [Dipteronia dyeriana]